MPISDPTLLLLGLAALGAGLIDALAGGGGLVLLPALFGALPAVAPATLLGTNKAGAIWGTAAAMRTYLRRITVPWAVVGVMAAAAFAGSLAGAATVSAVDPQLLRRLLPVLLAVVLIYTLMRKDLGQHHTPLPAGPRRTALAVLGGAVIGFYDGFFGPGTGSFLMLLFIRGFGFDFLRATAGAKVVNVCTNLAALLLFVSHGHLLPRLAVVLALCNMAGGLIGARLALRHGSVLVRRAFIAVVALLILKTAHDAFLR